MPLVSGVFGVRCRRQVQSLNPPSLPPLARPGENSSRSETLPIILRQFTLTFEEDKNQIVGWETLSVLMGSV